MAESYSLRYWLRGEPLSARRTRVLLKTTVGEFKQHLTPGQSTPGELVGNARLYIVAQKVDVRDLSTFGNLSISQLGEALDEEDTLQVIPEPSNRHFHIVIDGLVPVPIQCFLRNHAEEYSFELSIPLNITLNGLKNELLKVHFPATPAYCVKMYKISTYQSGPELTHILRTPGSGQYLMGGTWAYEAFNDVPFQHHPRVVLEILKSSLSMHPASPVAVKDPRAQYFQKLLASPLKAPSEQASPSQFRELQASDRRIEWTRPSGQSVGVPVTLLDPIFGDFVDECHDYDDARRNYDTDYLTNALAARLCSEMSNLFDKEKDRQEAFICIMKSFQVPIVPSSSQGCTTDGDLYVNGSRYVILEVKAEVGSKAAEPYCQGILYYITRTELEAKKAHDAALPFNFPCLIVTLFGPHLAFSGAVWGVRPVYQLLSTALPFFYHPTDTTMRRNAARHISAFLNTLEALKHRYQRYQESPLEFRDLQPEYPHPRSYEGSNGKTNFRYIRTLQQSKLLFVVQTDKGEDLCIKFVRRYDPKVHEQCARWGITPSLKAFVDDIPGGWQMVVMDFLEGYECLFDVKLTFSSQEQEKLKDELRAKLTDLHQMGFVHGDVRDTNLMVTRDRLHWRLVDFDWSGEITRVRYPMNVNRGVDLKRPVDACDGHLILAQHDIDMLRMAYDSTWQIGHAQPRALTVPEGV